MKPKTLAEIFEPVVITRFQLISASCFMIAIRLKRSRHIEVPKKNPFFVFFIIVFFLRPAACIGQSSMNFSELIFFAPVKIKRNFYSRF